MRQIPLQHVEHHLFHDSIRISRFAVPELKVKACVAVGEELVPYMPPHIVKSREWHPFELATHAQEWRPTQVLSLRDVEVEASLRRQGHFKSFLTLLEHMAEKHSHPLYIRHVLNPHVYDFFSLRPGYHALPPTPYFDDGFRPLPLTSLAPSFVRFSFEVESSPKPS